MVEGSESPRGAEEPNQLLTSPCICALRFPGSSLCAASCALWPIEVEGELLPPLYRRQN